MRFDKHEDEGKTYATLEFGTAAREVLVMDSWVLQKFRVPVAFVRGMVE